MPEPVTVAVGDAAVVGATAVGEVVSGRFEGEMAAPKPGSEILELRIDIDSRAPGVPTRRVSGDFYAVNAVNLPGSPPRTWRVYRESWVVEAPHVTRAAGAVIVTGSARFWEGTHPVATVEITLPTGGPVAGPAQVALTFQGGTIWRYTCPRVSDAFRSLELEVDVCQSVNQAPILPGYDIASHPHVPAGVPRRRLTIEQAYAEAGVAVTINPQQTIIDDSDPQFDRWSDAELHDAMESHFAAAALQWPRWSMWGLLAGTYENPAVGGIMFDAAADFGGAGQPPERQGFAVFKKHHWFANLPAGVPANDAEADALRKYLYTWIHEAGHAFNFLHSWDKNRPDALSWMNYDWRYDNRNGADAFWKSFLFRFDDEELIHLRHGNRAAVIMGGDPWASGGHIEAPPGAEHLRAAPAAIAHAVGGTPLELLLRSKGYFNFMEPVTIEARLRNLLPNIDLKVDTLLRPEFGGAVYFIRRPDGRIVEYSPISCKLAQGEIKTLAGSPQVPGLDRHSESVDLTYGRYGFYFDEPGEYLVRALYQGAGDLLIPSNTLRLRVGHPASADMDREAQDFFSYDVGMNLYLRGSSSPHLKRGFELLRQMADKYSNTIMGAELARVIVDAVARPFFRVEATAPADGHAVMKRVKTAAPEEALRFTTKALAVLQGTDQKSLNLAYRDLVQKRATCHQDLGDTTRARKELTTLKQDLAQRGANPPVLNAIQQRANSLAPQPKAASRTPKKTRTSPRPSGPRTSGAKPTRTTKGPVRRRRRTR
jgi:hypothetical protein